MTMKEKYGPLALVAGASEGIGAAFSHFLAAEGMDLVLVARRKEPLDQLAELLIEKYHVQVSTMVCDLADSNAVKQLVSALEGKQINLLVYNAAISSIGFFEKNSPLHLNETAQTNMITPMNLVHIFGDRMLKIGKGGIIMMASLAGFQGSGFITAYASTKAFTRVFAESLWYEWKDRGIDVMACCAGATATPGFIRSNPGKQAFFAPRVQEPEEVVAECMKHFGKRPSVITGRGNRIASFIMQRILPRKLAITIMGDTTRKMYRL